jgi:enamine deaminase RidA (YjgF/YER057c/UK114 family)
MAPIQRFPAQRISVSPSTIRRYRGPVATEFAILCRPGPEPQDIETQTASLYRALGVSVQQEGASMDQVLSETIYFANIGRDFDPFQRARLRTLGSIPQGQGYAPASTFIQQPPVEKGCLLALSAYAVDLNPGGASGQPSFSHPSQPNRREFQMNGCRHIFAGNIYGSPGSPVEESYSMFARAHDLLQRDGMSFRNVVRTWIHFRNIARDYSGFNRGRTDYFRRAGITRRPASTGIGGAPYPPVQNLSLSLYAIQTAADLEIEPMSTPTLNEAWAYGSDFSRGLKVGGENGITLLISGTASIDEAGRSVHVGDFDAQAERMMLNISKLLERQKASFRDVISATTYLKDAADASRLLRLLGRLDIGEFPNAVVQAEVCRPELLCEMEVLAKTGKRT